MKILRTSSKEIPIVRNDWWTVYKWHWQEQWLVLRLEQVPCVYLAGIPASWFTKLPAHHESNKSHNFYSGNLCVLEQEPAKERDPLAEAPRFIWLLNQLYEARKLGTHGNEERPCKCTCCGGCSFRTRSGGEVRNKTYALESTRIGHSRSVYLDWNPYAHVSLYTCRYARNFVDICEL